MKKLTFRTEIQKILFTEELKGQISDGAWENSGPSDHWEVWCDAEVDFGDNVGRDFHVKKDNYNLNSRHLVEVVGDRMVDMIKVHKAFPNMPHSLCEDAGSYSISKLREYASEPNSQFWQKMLNSILRYTDEDGLKTALESDSYSMKELNKDLKEMKKTLKTWKTK